jgi:hypothetical protein
VSCVVCVVRWPGFYETLRQELSPKYPIGVTLVCPGFVNTNINATRLGPNPTTFDISKAMPVEVCCCRTRLPSSPRTTSPLALAYSLAMCCLVGLSRRRGGSSCRR